MKVFICCIALHDPQKFIPLTKLQLDEGNTGQTKARILNLEFTLAPKQA